MQKSIYFYIIKEVAFSRGDIDAPRYFLRHWIETELSQKRQWFFLLKVGDFFPQSCWFLEPKLAIFLPQLWFKSGPRFIHDVEINGFWTPGCWWSLFGRPYFYIILAHFVQGGVDWPNHFLIFCVNFQSKSWFIMFYRKMPNHEKKTQIDFTVVPGPSTPGRLAFARSTPEIRDFDLFES